MELLSLEQGGELLLEVVGDHAVLLPAVSIPRRELPDELRRKFESRLGAKPSDIPLKALLGEIDAALRKPAKKPHAGVKRKTAPAVPRRMATAARV
jgi:hypothetical protein